jgi:hypothetical protein
MGDSYEDMKERYNEDKRKITEIFIQCVWDRIIKKAKARENVEGEDHHIVERATKAFLNLYQIVRVPVDGTNIFAGTNFENYSNSASHGLWPWMKHNTDVIRKVGRFYDIPNEEFYKALLKVVLNVPI